MKKLISIVLILSLLPYLAGCYSINQVSKEELQTDNSRGDLTIITNQNEIYKFEDGSYFIKSDTLFGMGIKAIADKQIPITNEIALGNITSIKGKESDGLKTAFLIVGIIGIVAAIGLAVFMHEAETEIFQIGK